MLNVGDKIKLNIKRLGINGEGIAYYNKTVVFVDGAIPGEFCELEITDIKEKSINAKLVNVLEKSNDRVEPKCRYYGRCAGCQVMHIDYNKMCEYKRDLIIEAINKYTKINYRKFEIKPTIKMSSPFNYRYKSQLPVRDFSGKATVGIYSTDGKEIVYIDSCMNQADDVNRINTEVLKYVDELNISPYLEKYRRGDLKHIVVRVSHSSKEAQVTLVVHDKTPKIFELAKKVINIPGVVSVYESINEDNKDANIFGDNLKLLEGKETIRESIGRYKFELMPNAFFQLNPYQTENLYELALKAAKLSHKEVVLDAFCGVGTIGIYLSSLAKEVIGIESIKEAVDNANNNAKINKIKNASFICGDVLDKLKTIDKVFDVIVCDPPRTGLGKNLCEAFINTNAKRIVYISCNPATLAKDLDVLSKSYNINYIQPVDMFPNTAHVETVCSLSQKKFKNKSSL